MENTTTLMKYLGVEEITTPKQQNNGTREFALQCRDIFLARA